MPDGPHAPGHPPFIDFPEALEVFFSRMDELQRLVGPGNAAAVAQVGELLRAALAARERGDVPAAMAGIARAMAQLADVVSAALPDEGPAMRAMVQHFEQSMRRGALGEAKDAAEVMRVKSGSTLRPKKD